MKGIVGSIRTWLKHRSRAQAVAAALFLLFVPTAFSIFPDLADLDDVARLVILGIWALVAVVVTLAQQAHEERVGQLAINEERRRGAIRIATTGNVLRTMLCPGTLGMPDEYEFTVYLIDGDYLVPLYPRIDLEEGESDFRVFKVGNGATGNAWKSGGTFVVTGDKVANSQYKLTAEQQARFAGFRTVAATPIEAFGERLGVLTTLSPLNDGHFNEGGSGIPTLERLAEMLGVVLKSIPKRSDLEPTLPSPVTPPG